MASPQPDKFTIISNELLEAFLKSKIPGLELCFWMFIARKTYGYRKKADPISLSQFQEFFGLSRRNVCTILERLEKKKMITRKRKGDFSTTILAIQKDYDLWINSAHKDTSVQKSTSAQELPKGSAQKSTYKRNLTKERIYTPLNGKSKNGKIKKEAHQVIEYLNKVTGKAFRPPTYEKKIMARLKHYSLKDLIQVIDNCSNWDYMQENPLYLRPETLFRNDTKVDQYLNMKTQKQRTTRSLS